MSSPALAENTNAAPAAAEPVVAAKKAKTSVEGKASPTKVVEAPAEEPKRKESGEGAVAEKPAEPAAAEPAKEVPVPRRQRFSSMAWRFSLSQRLTGSHTGRAREARRGARGAAEPDLRALRGVPGPAQARVAALGVHRVRDH